MGSVLHRVLPETRLAENNPLQLYYLSPSVIAAMSFSMIVYQAAYPCLHDCSVNNHRVLSFGLRCEIDSVTRSVSTVISMETERSWGAEEFLLIPCERYYKTVQRIELQRLLLWPRPTQLPTLPVRKIYCCPSAQIKRRRKKKKTLCGNQCGSPMCIHNGPFDQFILKIQLNCHGGRKESHMCFQCGHQNALAHQ